MANSNWPLAKIVWVAWMALGLILFIIWATNASTMGNGYWITALIMWIVGWGYYFAGRNSKNW